jgi:integrase
MATLPYTDSLGVNPEMARNKLPLYARCETSRHDRSVYYFKRPNQKRIRLPDTFGDDVWWTAYKAALAGAAIPTRNPKAASGSLRWLTDQYRASGAWSGLSMATRRSRENIFQKVIAKAGDEAFGDITRATIVRARDKQSATPFMANDFLKAMRGLFRWAIEAEHVKIDPTDGVKMLSRETTGFHAWTEDEAERFEQRWSVGTKERLMFAIALYSGLRRGDSARLGRQHVRDGVIEITTEKTGARIYVPVRRELQAIIDATPTPSNALAFVAQPNGKPYTKESWGNMFKDACVAAGVPGSAHGLRKLGATRLANVGATSHELQAVFGWESSRMAETYTKEADRARLARQAMEKLRRLKER